MKLMKIEMDLSKYLGKHSSVLLNINPFRKWGVTRRVDDDSCPPLVGYVFSGHGLQISCDRDAETIRSIFIETEKNDGVVLSQIPFNIERDALISLIGLPVKSGKKVTHAVLGSFGLWDRFQVGNYMLHIQYCVNVDKIEKITLMRGDVAPK